MTTLKQGTIVASRSIVLVGMLLVVSLSDVRCASGDDALPAAPSMTTPLKVRAVAPHQAGIGDFVTVQIDGLRKATETDKLKPRDLVLYLDGRPLQKVVPQRTDLAGGYLVYRLERTGESRGALDSLLGSPTSPTRKVELSVGLVDHYALPVEQGDDTTFTLIVFHRYWLIGSVIGLVAVIAFFILLARRSNIIRDSGPPQLPSAASKPYSLARLQATVWFFLVVASFVFIYLITGDYNTMTTQALVLIGIGTGTALGAAMVDATKRQAAVTALAQLQPEQARLTAEIGALRTRVSTLRATPASPPAATSATEADELRAAEVAIADKSAQLRTLDSKISDVASTQSKPVSEDFLTDILSDANGISFHRFQMLIWTIVLGLIFCVGVYRSLAMPAFSETLLALMGISAGTYLGFKIPERQT